MIHTPTSRGASSRRVCSRCGRSTRWRGRCAIISTGSSRWTTPSSRTSRLPCGRISGRLGRPIPTTPPPSSRNGLFAPLPPSPTPPMSRLLLLSPASAPPPQKARPPLSKRQEPLVRRRKVVGQSPTHPIPPPRRSPIRHHPHLLHRPLLPSVDRIRTRRFVGWTHRRLLASLSSLKQHIRSKARCSPSQCPQVGSNYVDYYIFSFLHCSLILHTIVALSLFLLLLSIHCIIRIPASWLVSCSYPCFMESCFISCIRIISLHRIHCRIHYCYSWHPPG
jgi:hypothetical protein